MIAAPEIFECPECGAEVNLFSADSICPHCGEVVDPELVERVDRAYEERQW